MATLKLERQGRGERRHPGGGEKERGRSLDNRNASRKNRAAFFTEQREGRNIASNGVEDPHLQESHHATQIKKTK